MQCIDFIREKMTDKELCSLEYGEENDDCHFIRGIIIGRRSMGRNLSFADVAINQPSASSSDDTNYYSSIKIIFVRQSFLGPEDQRDALNAPFPSKMTNLPYTASIIAQLGNCQKVPSKSSRVIEDVWEVKRWRIIEHPKQMAEELASLQLNASAQVELEERESSKQEKKNQSESIIIGSGAVMCSEYLKARGEAFEKASKHKKRLLDLKSHPDVQKFQNQIILSNSSQKDNSKIDAEEFHHGGKHTKAKRAKIFASWILEVFFGIPMSTEQDKLICQPCQGNAPSSPSSELRPQSVHVFDVAGGKGRLSLELILQQMHSSTSAISKCTIVDPMVRKSDAKQRHAKLKKASSRLRNKNENVEAPTIEHIATSFTKETFNEIYSLSLQNKEDDEARVQPKNSLLLGLHPDQCTEDILLTALEHNLSVAIIPCCVFPDLFPSRMIQRSSDHEERAVRHYSDFLQYLLDKDASLQLATLPFRGKNKVIYRRVETV